MCNHIVFYFGIRYFKITSLTYIWGDRVVQWFKWFTSQSRPSTSGFLASFCHVISASEPPPPLPPFLLSQLLSSSSQGLHGACPPVRAVEQLLYPQQKSRSPRREVEDTVTPAPCPPARPSTTRKGAPPASGSPNMATIRRVAGFSPRTTKGTPALAFGAKCLHSRLSFISISTSGLNQASSNRMPSTISVLAVCDWLVVVIWFARTFSLW